MFDRPNRLELLSDARETLVREVIPKLDGDEKYACLMVASAIATAIRELESDRSHETVRRVLDAFADVYGQDNVARSGEDGRARIKSLNRDLARDLRDGVFDEVMQGPVFAVLLEQAVQRLSLSNPRFLEASEFSQPSRS